MITIFSIIRDKLKLSKKQKKGHIEKASFEFDKYYTYDEMLEIYEEYRKKALLDNIYYLKGSNYMKLVIEKYKDNPQIYSFFMEHFNRVDAALPNIPLDIGEQIEEFCLTPGMRTGIHKSSSIGYGFDDRIITSIITKGLINNGAAMQGLVLDCVSPAHTVSNISSPTFAIYAVKTPFKGAFLLGFPTELVTDEFDIVKGCRDMVYTYHDGMTYIKPEFILGYLEKNKDGVKYYSIQELEKMHTKKEL